MNVAYITLAVKIFRKLNRDFFTVTDGKEVTVFLENCRNLFDVRLNFEYIVTADCNFCIGVFFQKSCECKTGYNLTQVSNLNADKSIL